MSFFKTQRFLPLLITQFLGAFNDNLFKNALVMLITYRLAQSTGGNAQMLVTIASGLFILPFFLFSATAGQLADKIERTKLIRIIKLVEIALMLVAAVGFISHSVVCLMVVLFGMGAHSTFFGPLKYALLPQHLQENELLAGNAAIEAGTFLAILLGTLAGGLLVLSTAGEWLISGGVILCALAGYVASRYIPQAPAPDPTLKIGANIWRETIELIKHSTHDRTVFLCILGISWFWLVGATFLSQFPAYTKNDLYADEKVVTIFLMLFSVGIGVGSFLSNKLLKGYISAVYVPLAALGISVFAFDLAAASQGAIVPVVADQLMSLTDFMGYGMHWRIMADLFLVGVCGGIYIVPLYALLQHKGEPKHLARLIASNNVMNALFMVVSSLAVLLLIGVGLSTAQIFLVVAVLNTVVAIYICKLLPDALLRSVMRAVFKFLYRADISGLENYHAAGPRVLLVANHTSFLDAALIAAFLPEKITFAINTHIAKKWWMQPLLLMVDALPLDPTNPLATKALIDKLKQGKPCMIFPEGRITVTGALMKIYEGPGMIADKAGAALLPIRIDGAQYSPFSRLKGKVAIRTFPKVSLSILPACQFVLPEDLHGRQRRQMAGAQLYDIMCQMMFASSNTQQTLLASVLEAANIHGRGHLVVEDMGRTPLSYGQFLTATFALATTLKKHLPPPQYVGFLLPNAVSSVVTFFALQALGRTPAMLNYSAGAAQIASACAVAQLNVVVTSRRFIELARMDTVIERLQADGLKIIYLEDVTQKMRPWHKLWGLAASYWPQLIVAKTQDNTQQNPAVILFTSGSEGTPKGVVLSHQNIQSNRQQLASRIDFGPADTVFNCLPIFHAFGLTAGTILPMLAGIKTFFYPSPLHYRIVPELIYDTNATILFGTDTFLAGYAKQAHPYDLHAVRYVFSGAERLRPETRQAYIEKFGVRIFEGYGATETAPVLSMNTPMQNRAGTTGRLMPGIEHKLMPVTGIDAGGQLLVKGPNIMQGYLLASNPGVLQPLADGWYDTGDIVAIDAQGFVAIQGRLKRFAKIAGEMVSLTAVEAAAAELWPTEVHGAVAVPDDKKGEQIILVSSRPNAARAELASHFKAIAMPDLAVPKTIIYAEKLPLLGTGKTDYQSLRAWVLENMG